MRLFSTKTKSTTKTKLPDYVKDASKDLYSQIMAASDQQFTPYKGDRVGALSNDTMMADKLVRQISAKNPIRLIDNLPGAGGKAGSLKDYMDPYTTGVLNPALRNIDESAGIDRNRLNAEAAMSGAFGDASHGIERGQIDRYAMQEKSDTTSKIMSDAFHSAMAMKGSDIGRYYDRKDQNIKSLVGMGQIKDNRAQMGADAKFQEFLRRIGNNQNNLSWATKTLSPVPYETTVQTKGKVPGGIGNALIGGAISLIPKI